MKKPVLLSAIAACFACMAFVMMPNPHTEVYKLNTQSSTLGWVGKKLTGEHKGTIKFLGGDLKDNHGTVTGRFDVDMNSIACTDLTGNSKEKLEKDLKSDNFFGVEKFPKATYTITSMVKAATNPEGNTHTISGNLTIRDKTNPVTFHAKFSEVGLDHHFTGTAVIDRSKFDVKYGSKSFFPDIGDKLIYDEFTLNFNVVLTKGMH